MIPKGCRRLAEVDFPLAKVGAAVLSREKKFPVPRGLPSTMHQWWARRPLGSCRAVLLGLMLPDPCDPYCPAEFKAEAAKALLEVPGWATDRMREQLNSDEGLRRAILDFIAEFSHWDKSSNAGYLRAARGLVRAAHGDESPLVVDPFAGGGAIPLEALRTGCDAFAGELNPVACLIVKALIDDIPRHGPELAEELRRVGAEIKREAERELADLYPKDPDGATPIAYLWARTVRCESPNCGAEIPIYRSPWLSKRGAARARYFKEDPEGPCVALLVASNPLGGPVGFRIARGHGNEDPRPGFVELKGTKAKGNNANVICPCCGTVLPGSKKNPRVPTQLAGQRGGADVVFDEKGNRIGGARLLAVVTLRPGEQGRHYRLPTERDYQAVRKAQARLAKILQDWKRAGKRGPCPVPDEPTPAGGGSGAGRAFSVRRYGMLQWGDLFTARQKVALLFFAEKIASLYRKGDPKSVATAELLAMAMDKVADFNCSLSGWRPSNEDVGHLFGRQALPIVWDFVETNLCCSSYVDFGRAVGHILEVVEHTARAVKHSGQVQIADARKPTLPEESAHVLFTDPPYYDAVPYSDLSDFFFVWLKRALPGHPLLRDPFDPTNPLTPKAAEIVQDETKKVDSRAKDRQFFEDSMAEAFRAGRLVLREDGVGSVIFAHKTTEGWEALLSGLIRGGWTITGSWPIATEMASRLRAMDSAALATSVHLVCRPRPEDAPVGDWADVLRELPQRVGDWMERLQNEGIRGADLVFACIGPALEIFSRCARVETAEGREIRLDEYLEKVWEVVGRMALEQVLGTAEAKASNSSVGALEEDARLTALFLWTLQSTNKQQAERSNQEAAQEQADEEPDDEEEEEEGASKKKKKGYRLVFDVVRRFAQPLGIHLEEWEDRIIDTEKGVVRLLSVTERANQLFGQDGGEAVAEELERRPERAPQLALFPDGEGAVPEIRARGKRRRVKVKGEGRIAAGREATTLDRVHAAMLLQAGGQTNALRALVEAETERGPDFLRLANALSALYPKGSEEKRLLDAMLLTVPR
ncbi:MAG: DNA methylase [Fimbriimonadales bacterium]|nr:MAG: DNA methylase [Fimbriimonadales bacterium]